MSKITIDRAVVEQALEDICGAKLCEINSMSSRHEMLRLMEKSAAALRAALDQPQVEQEPDEFYEWWGMRPSLTRLQAWLLWKEQA